MATSLSILIPATQSFSRTHFHAIPEHRARVLRATLSPRSKQRAGPVTVATLILGSEDVGRTWAPSSRYHSTLWSGRSESGSGSRNWMGVFGILRAA